MKNLFVECDICQNGSIIGKMHKLGRVVAMKVKEYAELYNMTVKRVYKRIKAGKIKASKNERGQYEIETEIPFPYLEDAKKERQVVERKIEECKVLLESQARLNEKFNQLIDDDDVTNGYARICPISEKMLYQQSATARYLESKLKLIDAKIQPIKEKYAFFEELIKGIPVVNPSASMTTISVYFEIDITMLPLLINRLNESKCTFCFTIQNIHPSLSIHGIKVRISDHLPSIDKAQQEHLLIQFPSKFVGKAAFDSQMKGLSQLEEMQMIIKEIKEMQHKKKVLWQEADHKKYIGLLLKLKTLPTESLNDRDQAFINHVFKESKYLLKK